MKDILQQSIEVIQNFIDKRFDGNISKACEFFELKNKSILYQWLNGTRKPTMNSMSPLFTKMGIALSLPDEKMEDFALIDKVEAKAGAGSSLVTSGEVIGKYAFRKDFLGTQHISPEKAVLLDVMGDSMEPLIMDGDTILVDQSDIEPRNDQIYLIGLDEECMVKRLLKIPQGWQIHSENERVKDINLIASELDYLRVLGRVRWFGRVL